MILATLVEFSYIPITWNNTSHLTSWLPFLLVTLALTAGPRLHRHRGEPGKRRWIPCSYPRYCPFFHLYRLNLANGIMPSGRMFRDRVAST